MQFYFSGTKAKAKYSVKNVHVYVKYVNYVNVTS